MRAPRCARLCVPPALTTRPADNTVWLFVAFSFLYAVGACLAGKKVLLPLVGDGADQQVM